MGLILNWNFSSMFWGISAWHLYLGIVAENTWWAFMREVISIYEGKEKILGYSIMWVTLLFNSVQFSRSVVSDSLRPHESQHARPPCPSPSPGVHSNSVSPSSWWCHSAISFSFIPFSSCSQISPSIRVFSNESTLRMRWPDAIFPAWNSSCISTLVYLGSTYGPQRNGASGKRLLIFFPAILIPACASSRPAFLMGH